MGKLQKLIELIECENCIDVVNECDKCSKKFVRETKIYCCYLFDEDGTPFNAHYCSPNCVVISLAKETEAN